MSILVVEALAKTYPGTRKSPPVEAVRGVSFTVERGEFFGLLGPNGAGKSTTIGCINTLVRPTSGRVLVDGIDVVRQPQEAKRRIAVVPQTRNLDRDLTVREVLTYHGRYFGLPAAERESRADRLLGELQIADKAQAKPLTLSGGQQQRVMIARALVTSPEVLLLDEPTTGVDTETQSLFYEMLHELNDRQKITIVLVTHDIGMVNRHVKKVACLNQQLIYHGSHKEFCQSEAFKILIAEGHIVSHSH